MQRLGSISKVRKGDERSNDMNKVKNFPRVLSPKKKKRETDPECWLGCHLLLLVGDSEARKEEMNCSALAPIVTKLSLNTDTRHTWFCASRYVFRLLVGVMDGGLQGLAAKGRKVPLYLTTSAHPSPL